MNLLIHHYYKNHQIETLGLKVINYDTKIDLFPPALNEKIFMLGL